MKLLVSLFMILFMGNSFAYVEAGKMIRCADSNDESSIAVEVVTEKNAKFTMALQTATETFLSEYGNRTHTQRFDVYKTQSGKTLEVESTYYFLSSENAVLTLENGQKIDLVCTTPEDI